MSSRGTRPAGRAGWYWLLILPFAGLLIPPIYARMDPVLWGVPFFYWYQFAWVILSSLVTGVVYLMTSRPDKKQAKEGTR